MGWFAAAGSGAGRKDLCCSPFLGSAGDTQCKPHPSHGQGKGPCAPFAPSDLPFWAPSTALSLLWILFTAFNQDLWEWGSAAPWKGQDPPVGALFCVLLAHSSGCPHLSGDDLKPSIPYSEWATCCFCMGLGFPPSQTLPVFCALCL